MELSQWFSLSLDTKLLERLKNEEAFLGWVHSEFNQNYSTNRLTKRFYAGSSIGAGMALYVDTDGRAHPLTDPLHYSQYVGMSCHGANSGDVISLVTTGILYKPGSGWSAGIPYFLGPGGRPSISGDFFLGIGIDQDRLLVRAPQSTSSTGTAPAAPLTSLKSTYLTGELIQGGKAVILDSDKRLYVFNPSLPTHFRKYVGIAEQTATPSTLCRVVTEGESNYVGSGWIAGSPYYIGPDGYLMTTLPPSGFVKQAGIGIDTDTLLVKSMPGYVKL
jgi:hypothetical protein